MHTITKKINNRYRNLSLVLLVFIMALTACDVDPDPPVLPRTLTLTATQAKIKQGTNAAVFPSRFMLFDITSDADWDVAEDNLGNRVDVELLLVPTSEKANPSTLSALRVYKDFTITDTDYTGSNPYSTKLSTRTALLSSSDPAYVKSTTTAYIGHDSKGNVYLEPNTSYDLFASQPNSKDPTPVKLGSFTTGARPAQSTTVVQIENISMGQHSGTLYWYNNEFISLNYTVNANNLGYSFYYNGSVLSDDTNGDNDGTDRITKSSFIVNTAPYVLNLQIFYGDEFHNTNTKNKALRLNMRFIDSLVTFISLE